jgi:hypothetical protein
VVVAVAVLILVLIVVIVAAAAVTVAVLIVVIVGAVVSVVVVPAVVVVAVVVRRQKFFHKCSFGFHVHSKIVRYNGTSLRSLLYMRLYTIKCILQINFTFIAIKRITLLFRI